MDEYEKEIELMDYLNVLWKRKWLIIIPTFFFAVIAGVYSFLLPAVWEVDAIIQPSQYILQTIDGTYQEILIADPKQIAEQINEAVYNHIIAAELNLDIREIPKLKAENLKDFKLVKISIKANDVEKAKLILLSLHNYLKRQLDKKLDTEIKSIDSQIKSKEIEKFTKEEEINVYKNKLNIIKQRKKEIENEMIDIRKRIEKLEKEQRSISKKENRSETESLALLLYSNEIQQSSQYYSALNELLSSKKIEKEDINLEIKNKEKASKLLEINIDNLNETKGRIDYAQLIKEPTSSLSPVAPKKKINVLITSIISLMVFTMLAFLLEYLEKHKAKSKC